MTRRVQAPETHRRKPSAAKPRLDTERVSLKPLTYEEAVRGLFSLKPDPDETDPEEREEADHAEDS